MGSGRRNRTHKRRRISERKSYKDDSSSSVSSSSSEEYRSRNRKKLRKNKNKSKHTSNKKDEQRKVSENESMINNRSHTPPTPLVQKEPCVIRSNNDGAISSFKTNTMQISNSSTSQFPLHINVIPEFDPKDGSQNIESWINKVNECAQIYSWNEGQTCHFALGKLVGLAKRWYQGLPTLLYTWNEWQEKLKGAFPSMENYGDLLQKMLNMRCKIGQELDVYYYEKMILINKCEISGRKAVGCLIHGIDDKFIRVSSNACCFDKPEQLFLYLKTLSQSDSYVIANHNMPLNRGIGQQGKTINTTSGSSKPDIVCYNCGEMGHIRTRCTKPVKRCNVCRRVGHLAQDCRYRFNVVNNMEHNSNTKPLIQPTIPSAGQNIMNIQTQDEKNSSEIIYKCSNNNSKVQSNIKESAKYFKYIKIESRILEAVL